jgi:hypothetical protein
MILWGYFWYYLFNFLMDECDKNLMFKVKKLSITYFMPSMQPNRKWPRPRRISRVHTRNAVRKALPDWHQKALLQLLRHHSQREETQRQTAPAVCGRSDPWTSAVGYWLGCQRLDEWSRRSSASGRISIRSPSSENLIRVTGYIQNRV